VASSLAGSARQVMPSMWPRRPLVHVSLRQQDDGGSTTASCWRLGHPADAGDRTTPPSEEEREVAAARSGPSDLLRHRGRSVWGARPLPSPGLRSPGLHPHAGESPPV
jgi:hypothetical protein